MLVYPINQGLCFVNRVVHPKSCDLGREGIFGGFFCGFLNFLGVFDFEAVPKKTAKKPPKFWGVFLRRFDFLGVFFAAFFGTASKSKT